MTPRHINQLGFISVLITNIRYINEENNNVADANSRIDAFRLSTVINFNELSQAQAIDHELTQLLQDNNTS